MKYCIILILILISDISFSQGKLTLEQEQKIDSLKKIIAVLPIDSNLINAYYQWERIITPVDPAKQLELNLKINEICSEKLKTTENSNEKSYFQNSSMIALTKIAAYHSGKGDIPTAISFFKAALDLAIIAGNKKYESKCLYNIALMYSMVGEVPTAIPYYNTALKIDEENGDKNSQSNILGNLGTSYFVLGNYSKSIEYAMQALKLQIGIQNNRGIANSYSALGNCYIQMGLFEQSLENHKLALKYFQDAKDFKGEGQCLTNIGIVYKSWDKYDTALVYLKKSLLLNETTGNKIGIASALNNIGQSLENQEHYDEALEYSLKGLQLREELNDKRGIMFSSNYVGHLYAVQHNKSKTLEYSNRAYKIAIEFGSLSQKRIYHKNMIMIYNAFKQADSVAFFVSGLKSINDYDLEVNYFTFAELEKESFFQTIENNYSYYFDFALKNDSVYPFNTDTAYNLALMIKGLTLKSSTAMRMAISKSNNKDLITSYDTWLKLKKQIAGGKGDLSKLETEANTLEKELIKQSKIFDEFDKVKNLDWKKVQKQLKADECAIEFIHFPSFFDTAHPIIYVALLIRSDSQHPEMIELCSEKDLTAILAKKSGNDKTFANSLYGTKKLAQTELYEKIWKPIDKHLKGIKTIYYSPSGLLHKLSFSALSISNQMFLSDNFNLNQLSSTGNLAMQTTPIFTDDEKYFLMGGVKYDSDSSHSHVWEYLPGTYKESENISGFLKKNKYAVTYFSDKFATEETFKSSISNSTVAHISTHGFFYPDPEKAALETKTESIIVKDIKFRGTTNYANWSFVKNKNPLMRSGLVMARANDVWERDEATEGDDGILTALEVSNLDLSNMKLVVLSACETGLGDIKGSEGVFGLQRAFKMAGTKYIIMSLWQVPDEETSEFMQMFYKNLVKDKNVRAAFDKTQKFMRKKYDPYFWGAFVLME